ncbi:hypothetical protein, partial [Staphylococcus aureus]|uniref:hypothetical protein n=1 Tax=Staphylococcus aureus TaxID=1280 RepID=UPI0038B336E7
VAPVHEVDLQLPNPDVAEIRVRVHFGQDATIKFMEIDILLRQEWGMICEAIVNLAVGIRILAIVS